MFELRTQGPVQVVKLLDSKIVSDEAIDELAAQLYALVETEGHRHLLLDFGNVEYLSSAALSRLIQLKKKLNAVSGKLKLCCIEADLLEVFRITRLDTVFEIHKDQESALARS